jgi:hypothetical protein
MGISEWVSELTERTFGKSAMKIGRIIKHPDGRYVEVVDGCLWADGGYSNFWFWREVKPDGTLGRFEYGYGWTEREIEASTSAEEQDVSPMELSSPYGVPRPVQG